MSLEFIENRLHEKMLAAGALEARVKFDFGEEGLIFVDATQNPPVISREDGGDADLVLAVSADLFKKILQGAQDPNMAYMMGKLKIQGSMGLAMKLNAILDE